MLYILFYAYYTMHYAMHILCYAYTMHPLYLYYFIPVPPISWITSSTQNTYYIQTTYYTLHTTYYILHTTYYILLYVSYVSNPLSIQTTYSIQKGWQGGSLVTDVFASIPWEMFSLLPGMHVCSIRLHSRLHSIRLLYMYIRICTCSHTLLYQAWATIYMCICIRLHI
jgi:hypothetical protein